MQKPSKTVDATTLLASPPLRRLQVNLSDILIIACERFCIPGAQLHLSTLHYVSDEKHADRFCMHFEGLVKEAGRIGNIPLQVSFIVRTPTEDWLGC